MIIEVKHLDFLFTERFNVKKMIKDIEKWISENNLKQEDFIFEIDKDDYSKFNMSASLKFILRNETFSFSYKRILNFIQTIEDRDHVEIELFKLNVLDLINQYSNLKIKTEDIVDNDKNKNLLKEYQIKDGEKIITVIGEDFFNENYHMIDNIFLINSHDETPDDVKKRLKQKKIKDFT